MEEDVGRNSNIVSPKCDDHTTANCLELVLGMQMHLKKTDLLISDHNSDLKEIV